ncbi:MAG: hypothetical protein QHH02_08210 [Syntrophomonadaceae bacterium]|nr:hypothetical protein [Syntrophomonadaceae bacterium]
MGYTVLLLALASFGAFVCWLNRRNVEATRLRAERERLEEILQECTLVRSDLEQLLAQISERSTELVKQLEGARPPRAATPAKKNATNPAAGAEPPTPVPERYRGVSQLLENGRDPREVAEKLKIGVGEVQLLLNLNRRRQPFPPAE